jgi:hypothetical protein
LSTRGERAYSTSRRRTGRISLCCTIEEREREKGKGRKTDLNGHIFLAPASPARRDDEVDLFVLDPSVHLLVDKADLVWDYQASDVGEETSFMRLEGGGDPRTGSVESCVLCSRV